MAVDEDPFLASLDHLVADAVAEEAARERSQERTLHEIAESEATLAGLLLDRSERRSPVVVRTTGGRAHRGQVLAVGRDFVVLRDRPRPPVMVALDAVAAVRPEPEDRSAAATGGRAAPLNVSLAALLARLSGDRPRVLVAAAGDEPVAGQLRSVGLDVLTLRLDGDHRLSVHVALAALAEITLLDL